MVVQYLYFLLLDALLIWIVLVECHHFCTDRTQITAIGERGWRGYIVGVWAGEGEEDEGGGRSSEFGDGSGPPVEGRGGRPLLATSPPLLLQRHPPIHCSLSAATQLRLRQLVGSRFLPCMLTTSSDCLLNMYKAIHAHFPSLCFFLFISVKTLCWSWLIWVSWFCKLDADAC